jgi:hypothetical protein
VHDRRGEGRGRSIRDALEPGSQFRRAVDISARWSGLPKSPRHDAGKGIQESSYDHKHPEVLESISRFSTWLASVPVNASPLSLRTPAHDSGLGWIANPSLYRTFTNYTPPAFDGAFKGLTARPVRVA